ncbi:MAG TPA: Crp/Fnr family transcriptional regulator [Puia sp.]|nr:Crp/Fnr family transcriptional regulator [Puia sp.]
MQVKEKGLYNYLIEKNIPLLNDKTFLKGFKKGELVYGPSQHYTYIYEIVSGAVKLGSISSRGLEIVHEIVTPGELFGNLRLLDDHAGLFGLLQGLHKPFSEFSKTLAPTLLRCYEYDFFKRLMINDPNVAEWFYPKIVSRWCKTESLLISIRSMEPRERIRHIYELYSTRIKTASDKVIPLNTSLSLKDLADLTATTRQLVADTLKG